MTFQIIKRSVVTRQSENELVLKNGTYLSEAIDRLPSGIIDKKIPGIGATTCELDSPRNSVIVEPFKAVASSKAFNHNALYVGSPTNLHSSAKKSVIKDYHENTEIEFKKIVIVADSLKKVIQAIGIEEFYSSYFFTIDEIDTFQLDSTYRERLEYCIDVYFKFAQEQRCLITATLLDFSNQQLIDEPLRKINYETEPEKEIYVHKSNTVQYALIELIKKIYSQDGDSTMVIAYNSIESIRSIIGALDEQFKEECSILCSSGSKEEAGRYYDTLLDNRLPTIINFITSAYYSGVDILEDYHSILVSDVNYPYCLLSVDKIKQITGRCRRKVLSENLIFSINNNQTWELNNLKEHKNYLFKKAEAEIQALKCIDDAYKNDNFLKKVTEDVIKNFINSSASGDKANKLVRKNLEGKFDYSYFNIDADYEQTKLENKTYTDYDILCEDLEDNNYVVNELDIDYNTYKDDTNDKSEKNSEAEYERKKQMKEEVLEDIQNNIKKISDFDANFRQKYFDSGSKTKKETIILFDEIFELIEEKPVENTIRLLKDNYIEEMNKRKFNNIYRQLYFETLDENKVKFKKEIYEQFPIGDRINRRIAKERLENIYRKNFLSQFANTLKETNVRTHLGWYFEISKNKDKHQQIEGQSTIIIKDRNPLKTIKTKKITKTRNMSINPLLRMIRYQKL